VYCFGTQIGDKKEKLNINFRDLEGIPRSFPGFYSRNLVLFELNNLT
jgi:hypothetical protein